VHAAVSHGVFAVGAMEGIQRSPILSLLVTDSVESQPEPLGSKIEIVSVAPLLGEAIRRIHNRESISDLFENP
jgi:ribose-phosphate pyrophosphokinase